MRIIAPERRQTLIICRNHLYWSKYGIRETPLVEARKMSIIMQESLMKKIALLFLLIALAGCGKKEAQKQNSTTPSAGGDELTNVILPLKTGNTWVYDVYGLDTVKDRHILIRVDTFEILNDTVIDGEKWWDTRQIGHKKAWVINRKDGLWLRFREDSIPFLWVKYPGFIEDEYKSVIMGVPSSNKILTNNIAVEVPAGKFDCYAYGQYIGKQQILTRYYFTPNKGLIKMEIPDSTHTKVIYGMDLMKMELK